MSIEFAELLEDLIDERTGDIMLGMVGKIQSFDRKKMRASVQPLMKGKTFKGEVYAYPVLPDIPVSFICAGDFFVRPVYKQGDLVWISFSTHDTEDALNNTATAASEDMFGLENACVMGGIAKTGWTNPDAFSKQGMVVGFKNNSGDTFMHFDDTKNEISFSVDGSEVFKITSEGTETTGDVKASGDTEVEGDIKAEGDLKTEGDVYWDTKGMNLSGKTHKHPSAVPGAPSPAV